ncbi:hypothetical protein diail_298 [Diaporthe ilicicola]|nr:hypothetical protein diail_298 [Diaporthe ilicicola]
MSPVVRATTATLAGVLNTISGLSGGSNGSAVTDFTNKSVNILSPLLGPNKAGVATGVISDPERYHFPLCDVGSDEIPDAFCTHPREIMVSLFYPACPAPSGRQPEPVLPDEQYFAPVFSSSTLLANISQNVAGGPVGLHNLMSQALYNAPACKGQYPMVIFAPTAGGQRQAYTQAASELASLGHVVVTVDHPYVSGAVEQPSHNTVNLGVSNTWIDRHETLLIQTEDVQFVRSHFTKESSLSDFPFTVQTDSCVFGHGSGGKVAQMMVDTHVVKCGGPLEGVLTLPAPFDQPQTFASSKPPMNDPDTNSSKDRLTKHRLLQILEDLGTGTMKIFGHVVAGPQPVSLKDISTKDRLLGTLKDLQTIAVNTCGRVICRIAGNCEIQKRSVGGDPRYPPKEPCYKDPCDDEDHGYKDGKDKYSEPCEDPCDTYDPCDPDEDPYPKPPTPYPPPAPYLPVPYPPSGIFPPGALPPNITWPPYGEDKTRPDDRPWDDQWDDYHNDGGDYEGRYRGGDCDYYDRGYKDGYECHDNDKDHGDHDHDHYRAWDKKHHPHGHVDDYNEDEDHDVYYDHEDDYGGDEFNYGDQDDYGYEYDEAKDHGYVDDWD